ncbi:MAG TPA: MATE family efflux transporter [Sphaerochaeta sp.]|jgi:putative MATE family efflux protein|nr:MATE family efflux transporter [Spirochaetota bacterium]NLV60040.1 MATE family efflux transporter [Spirochaetales bacterium]HOE84732.1 MATE family efflux transporter [Sphaerochaeta sp.]HOQ94776.1 MATE family efflux transporter [Sphaerochaeta sp.]HPK46384.1 MATE family efflux transporter [Sphaerochaeta sp.]
MGEYSGLNKEIRRISLPTMYGMLFTSLYDIVDMFYIGMIGSEAVAATTIYLALFWALEILNEIVGTSSVSLLSRSWGSKDRERTRRIAEQTLVFKGLLGAIGAVLLLATLPFCYKIFTSDAEVIAHGLSYGYVRTLFIPIFFSSYTVNTILRSVGDAKTPMYLLLITAILNLVLDPIFMFDTIPLIGLPGLGWGMAGAALATGISYLVAFLAGYLHLVRGKAALTIRAKGIFTLDRELDKELLTIGLPSGLNMLLKSVVGFIFLRIVAVYGTMAIAALGVANRIYHFAALPSGGLSLGSGFLVGQRIGSGRLDEARSIAYLSVANGLLFSLPLMAILLLFPSQILSVFLPDATQAVEGAVSLVRIYAVCLIPLAINGGIGAAFYGSGHVRPVLYSFLVSGYLVQLPYALLVALLFKLPLSWLWGAFLLGDLVECILRYRWFKTGKWALHS